VGIAGEVSGYENLFEHGLPLSYLPLLNISIW
jgi:hypothetical protein